MFVDRAFHASVVYPDAVGHGLAGLVHHFQKTTGHFRDLTVFFCNDAVQLTDSVRHKVLIARAQGGLAVAGGRDGVS